MYPIINPTIDIIRPFFLQLFLVKKLSVGQRRALSEFFTNAAVAWLSAGVIAPFFISRRLEDFVTFGTWGLLFTLVFLIISLSLTKGVKI